MLVVDRRSGGNVPKLEETIEQVNLKNAKAKQVFLGYTRFDVIKNKARLIFGKYNPWPLITTQVQALVHSFHVDGVDQFNLQFSIPLIIDKSILQPGCWVLDMESVDSLPDLVGDKQNCCGMFTYLHKHASH